MDQISLVKKFFYGISIKVVIKYDPLYHLMYDPKDFYYGYGKLFISTHFINDTIAATFNRKNKIC